MFRQIIILQVCNYTANCIRPRICEARAHLIISIYIALYNALLKTLLYKTNTILFLKKMIEFESEKKTIHCVRMIIQRRRDTQHYRMLKTSKPNQK